MHKLTRTGLAPVAFEGEVIAQASSRYVRGQDHNRWHEVAVYRTAGGNYVVSVAYRTQWQGEDDYHWALEAGAPASVEMRLREIGAEINQPIQGYPPGAQYQERQARMLHDVQQRFESLVSEVLGGDEFAEKLD